MHMIPTKANISDAVGLTIPLNLLCSSSNSAFSLSTNWHMACHTEQQRNASRQPLADCPSFIIYHCDCEQDRSICSMQEELSDYKDATNCFSFVIMQPTNAWAQRSFFYLQFTCCRCSDLSGAACMISSRWACAVTFMHCACSLLCNEQLILQFKLHLTSNKINHNLLLVV